MADIIQIRRDTSANWTSANPVMAQGELGIETNTNKVKAGDGSTAWSSLTYLIDAGDYLTATSTTTMTNKTLSAGVLAGVTTTASGDMELDPATRTVVVKGGGSDEGSIKLNCAANSHGQTITAQPHSENVTNEMLLPKGANSTLVSKVSVDTLTNKTLQGYAETTNAIGNATGAKTIDLTLGNSVTATTTGGTTWTFSGAAAADELSAFSIKLVNGGSATQTWPTSVDWPAATAPTLTTSGTDVLVFITCDGGTTWYGFVAGLALA